MVGHKARWCRGRIKPIEGYMFKQVNALGKEKKYPILVWRRKQSQEEGSPNLVHIAQEISMSA